MQLDWERLRLFHAVAEAGSFTEAARRLHMSQPALSRQIQTLESSINAIVITKMEAGGNLVEYVNPAFSRVTGYAAAEVLGKPAAAALAAIWLIMAVGLRTSEDVVTGQTQHTTT